jgi:uncharacterized protein YjbI with pentapeptide repeats
LGILAIISQPFGVTLWDWMQLLVVPAVIAAGGVWFNRQQKARDDWVAERRAQDETLQAYLDDIGRLLLDGDHPLRDPDKGGEARVLARAQTVTALSRLDAAHNRNILNFLSDSGLIGDPDNPIINLSGADLDSAKLNATKLIGVVLREANLDGAELNSADLRGADMREASLFDTELVGARLNNADLRGARVVYADLSGVDLTGADLRGANFRGTNLAQALVSESQLLRCESLEVATMPDGSVHD